MNNCFRFTSVHIWASPPSQGDDYMFYRHPPHQKLPDHERLRQWYENILKRGLAENIILENEVSIIYFSKR